VKRGANRRRFFFVITGLNATAAAAISIFLTLVGHAWSQPVQGSLEVGWDEGAANCGAIPHEPLQVHAYDSQTFILRQSLCASFEGNFLYLLVGSDKALLIDTGAVADSTQMPLAKKVFELLPDKDNAKIPLLVVHTHGHLDHRAGDSQFSIPSVKVVPANLEAVRAFFAFANWPDGIAQVELGDRTIDVIPTPGHHPAHVAFYDRRTGILFSGDFLMPARLTMEDFSAYHASAVRVVDFVRVRPLTHILGGHIELDTTGHAYGMGSHYHPNERRLELSKEDLLALPAALTGFNGFYARYPTFILSNPRHNLAALAISAVALLIFIVWAVRRLLRRHRRSTP
jgi:glyoxylase-like metal-dependent hydrolase (beta-lactamase superfamily II)